MAAVQELIQLQTSKLLTKHSIANPCFSKPNTKNNSITTTLSGGMLQLFSADKCSLSVAVEQDHVFVCGCVAIGNHVFGYVDKLYKYSASDKPVSRSLPPVFELFLTTFKDQECLVAVHASGAISIINEDLKTVKSLDLKNTDSKVVYAHLKENSLELVTVKEGVYEHHAYTIANEITHQSTSTIVIDPRFSVMAVGNGYVFASYPSQVVRGYSIESGQKVMEISLEPYVDAAVSGSLAMVCLSSGYLAIISQKSNKNFLTLWDTKYGTLQLQEEVQGAQTDQEEHPIRSYSIQAGSSEHYGDSLVISVAGKSKTKSKTVAAQFSIIPYYLPQLSLLTSLGKQSGADAVFDQDTFEGQLASVIPVPPPAAADKKKQMKAWKSKVTEWSSMDQKYLDRLCDAKETKTVESFQSVFVDWVFSANVQLRTWAHGQAPKLKRSKRDTSNSLLHLPRVELSHKSTAALLKRAFTDVKAFWPRAVVEYLIWSGSVSSDMVPCGLIDTLISLNEISLIELCFDRVMDMSEADYVSVIIYTCTEESDEFFASYWRQRAARQTASDSKQDPSILARSASKAVEKTDDGNDGDAVLCKRMFIHHCFSHPRVDATFTAQLKRLSTRDLLIVLEYFRVHLAPTFDPSLTNRTPGQKFPLWWVWYDNPYEVDYKAELDTQFSIYETALDAFALLLDAHSTSIQLDKSVQASVGVISAAVKRDTDLFSKLDSKLRGPLLASVVEKKPDSRGGERGGKKFRELVEQVSQGVGEYCVEVMFV